MLACIWTVALTTTEGDEAVLLPLLHALCSVPHYGSPWWPGKAMEKVGSHTRSTPGGFLAAPRSPPLFAIGYFLRRRTGILILPSSTPPQAGQVWYRIYRRDLRCRFPIPACCFAQSHRVNCWWNKSVRSGRFSSAQRVSHLSPCRRCEGALGRTRRCGCRITGTPNRLPLAP